MRWHWQVVQAFHSLLCWNCEWEKSNLLQQIPFFISSLPGSMHDFKAFILCVCWLWLNSIRSSKKSTFSSSFAPFSVSIHTAPPIMRFSELWVFPFFSSISPQHRRRRRLNALCISFSFQIEEMFFRSLSAQSHNHIWKRENASKNCCYICGIVDWSFRLVNAFVFHSKMSATFCANSKVFPLGFFLLHIDEFSREEILKLSSHPAISSEKNR